MRSLLLVPVADAAAVEAALRAEADALVLCLEDAVSGEIGRAAARGDAFDLLRLVQARAERPHLYVRLCDVDRASFDEDLMAVMAGAPDGILLGRARTGADVQHLGAKLAVQEAEHGLAEGEIGIIAEAGAHAQGLFGLGSYGGASARLVGLSWDAAGLAADLGGDPEACASPAFGPLQTARHLTLFAARAATVAAIDTASGMRGETDFATECRLARREGFNAKVAATPAQVAVINAVFGHDEG